MDGIHHLRVLIANQRSDRLEVLAQVVTGLGHEVIAREIHVSDVAAVTARERPDVALVGLGESAEHALEQISEIVVRGVLPRDRAARRLRRRLGERGRVARCLRLHRRQQAGRAAERDRHHPAPLRRVPGLAGGVRPPHRRDGPRAAAHRRASSGSCSSSTTASCSRSRSPSSRWSSTGPRSRRKRCSLALENTRAIVSSSLDELRRQGVPLHDLIRDSAPT